jgi:GTP cyclohydrolase II
MILVSRSKKKIIGLDGYGIKIVKQEILKWRIKKF